MPNYTTNYYRDGTGEAPTPYGAVGVRYASLTWEDDGTAIDLFTLPQGAVIVDAYLVGITAFNAASSNTCDIGLATDPDGLFDGADIDTTLATGAIYRSVTAQVWGDPLPADTVVKGLYIQTGTAADAGELKVVVWYVIK